MPANSDPAPSDNAAKRAKLIEIIRERSFQTGQEMKLASGRTSQFYFNMKPTMMHPEGAALIASLILDDVGADGADLIGGLEMGAVPLAASVAAISHSENRPLATFFVRKQVKEHGTQAMIEGLAPDETMTGKRVVVLEDVTTTGGSALKAVDVVRGAGGEVVKVITVVDRLEGAQDAFKEAGIAFAALLSADDVKE